MTVTMKDVQSMYRPLRREAKKVFGYDPCPPLAFAPIGTALGATDFFLFAEKPLHIIFNELILGICDEDEAEMILRHEIAHAYAGVHAQHHAEWQVAAKAMRALPEPYFTLRRTNDLSKRLGRMAIAEHLIIPTMDREDVSPSWR